jgi:uncharacterized protein
MLTLENARAWYTDDDPVHDFSHIERVYHLAERLAIAENADMEIVRAATLLHDAQGSASGQDLRKEHHLASAEFAGQILRAEGWRQESIAAVQHCIRAHRFRAGARTEAPESLEAKILFDADKLDVIGAIGVARVLAYAVLAKMPFLVQPSRQFLETGHEEPGEPHSAYHELLYKLVKIKNRMFTNGGKALAEERHNYIVEYFQRLQAEIRGEL